MASRMKNKQVAAENPQAGLADVLQSPAFGTAVQMLQQRFGQSPTNMAQMGPAMPAPHTTEGMVNLPGGPESAIGRLPPGGLEAAFGLPPGMNANPMLRPGINGPGMRQPAPREVPRWQQINAERGTQRFANQGEYDARLAQARKDKSRMKKGK